MPDFRRGAAAIKEAAEAAKNRGGGNFRPFVPTIYWKDDDDHRSKYILVLNKVDEIPNIDTISFIPVKNGDSTYYETVIARTDAAIGESVDPMVRDWDGYAQESVAMVAVELEPLVEEDEKGRKRPRGFEVKTTEFTRRVRDDDGELTDETEEVVAPVIGVVIQRASNFGSPLVSYDENDAPIHETAIKVTRQSTKPATFQIQGYPDQEVDLTNLLEYVDGITYLNDEMDDLIEAIAEVEDDFEAANVIGNMMLDKRLEELGDEERYQEIYEQITESLDKYGNKNKGKDKKADKKPARKAKPSQRRSRRSEPEPEQESQAPETEPEGETEPEEKAKPKAADDRKAKLAELRAKAAARKAAA